jgi:hypothetical protein
MLAHQIGQQLCDALGLPKNTVGFTLRCYANEIVSVACEYFPEDRGLAKAMARYNVVLADGAASELKAVSFNTWMQQRTERAHREFMERTSELPSCGGRESLAEKIDRYLGELRY